MGEKCPKCPSATLQVNDRVGRGRRYDTVRRDMALTPKQERFAQLVARGVDTLDAIKQVGYKATSASKQAYRMAQNDAVQARIIELKALLLLQQADAQTPTPKTAPQNPIRPNHQTAVQQKMGALAFLHSVYTDPQYEIKMRISAAVAALPYEEAKIAQTGKKDDQQQKAAELSKTGKFGTYRAQSDLFS